MNSDYCVKLYENDDVYVVIKQIPGYSLIKTISQLLV